MSPGTRLELVPHVHSLIVLLILLGLGYKIASPEQRTRLARAALALLLRLKEAVVPPERDPFLEALRARIPWAIVTLALAALNASIFVFMLFGAGALADTKTLIGWGGNFGPRTTNGEWWRLVTAMFVHVGMVHLVANIAGFVQLGLILERLVGRLAFAAVYFAAGIFASLVSLSAYPVDVSVGASGAVSGIYGLLLATSICGVLQLSSVTIPLTVLKRLVPAAAVFFLYTVATGDLESAAMGLVVGFVGGFALTVGAGDLEPSQRRVGAATASALVLAAAAGFPLRGIADVRPEIARVVALEGRTASAFKTEAERFRVGRVPPEGLAQLIERTIVPELEAAQARLKGLQRVPQEHQPIVTDAEEYLRLRCESWRLRADALRKTSRPSVRETVRTEQAANDNWRLRAEAQHRANYAALGKAEGAERASLVAFQKIRPLDQN